MGVKPDRYLESVCKPCKMKESIRICHILQNKNNCQLFVFYLLRTKFDKHSRIKTPLVDTILKLLLR